MRDSIAKHGTQYAQTPAAATMANDTKTPSISRSERPRRRGWDRRRDLGRRMIRDRRRETLEVPFERRLGGERRSGLQRRATSERRVTPPEGFHLLDG